MVPVHSQELYFFSPYDSEIFVQKGILALLLKVYSCRHNVPCALNTQCSVRVECLYTLNISLSAEQAPVIMARAEHHA